MASTIKGFLPLGWENIQDGEVVIKSATGVVGGSLAGGDLTLDSLSNVTIASNSAGEILKWNGTAWVNNTVTEAFIAALNHSHTPMEIESGATPSGWVLTADGATSSYFGPISSGDSPDDDTEFASKVLLLGSSGIATSIYISGQELFYLNNVSSNIQTQFNNITNKQHQSIRVNYAASTPVKAAGHASLGVAAFPGAGQFRVTHSQGNTNFAVQVQRINSVPFNDGSPSLAPANLSTPHVTVTSTYIDVWFLLHDLSFFQVIDVDFFLTLLPY